jgi:hypothetical protein
VVRVLIEARVQHALIPFLSILGTNAENANNLCTTFQTCAQSNASAFQLIKTQRTKSFAIFAILPKITSLMQVTNASAKKDSKMSTQSVKTSAGMD